MPSSEVSLVTPPRETNCAAPLSTSVPYAVPPAETVWLPWPLSTASEVTPPE